MTRRIEAGPALVIGGALLLLVALFQDFYAPSVTAWRAFELVDVLLAALALGAGLTAAGLFAPGLAFLERRWLAPLVAAAALLVIVALLDPPPTVRDGDPRTGLWLALGAAALMGLGALLTFARISVAFDVQGRDPRRRVAAVDARGSGAPGEAFAADGGVTQPFAPVARITEEPAVAARRLSPRGPGAGAPAEGIGGVVPAGGGVGPGDVVPASTPGLRTVAPGGAPAPSAPSSEPSPSP